MIRFLFRLLATLALAIAVILAVLDTTRTLAASSLVMTPLATSWNALSPDTLDAFRAFVTAKAGAGAWDPVIVAVLAQPGFAVFLVIAVLLYAVGRRPRTGRFAVEA